MSKEELKKHVHIFQKENVTVEDIAKEFRKQKIKYKFHLHKWPIGSVRYGQVEQNNKTLI